MYEKTKRVLVGLFAVIFATVLITPAISFGDTADKGSSPEGSAETESLIEAYENEAIESSADLSQASAVVESPAPAEDVVSDTVQSSPAVEPSAAETSSEEKAGDCTLTLEYYEIVTYEDPDKPAGPDGRRLMGSRVLTGFNEGDYIDTWDYVVDIPGYFFFDAWPARLNISTNPADNLIELSYARLWNNEYTVNYYLMANADLSGDSWSDVLSSGDVLFYKMGSQTFANQPFDMLVEGDAYEYSLDGLYVIDTYPAQIRVGTDADNNVINVLYTTEASTLPDSVAIPDGVMDEQPDDGQPPAVLPDDEEFGKDDLIPALPEDALNPDNSGIYDDFLGSAADRGELEITDEMLAHPLDKDEATLVSNAYQTGVLQGSALVQTGDTNKLIIPTVVAIAAILIIGISLFIYWRQRRENAKSPSV